MAGYVSIRVDDAAAQAAIQRVADAGGDTLSLLSLIGGYMVTATQRRFETETGPDGVKWAPMAKRTAARRAKRKGANTPATPKLLRDKNLLFQSVQEAHTTEDETVIGSNLPYALIQQQGGTVRRNAMSRMVSFRKAGARTLFAKKSHKRVTKRPVTFGSSATVIPARPYLGFSDEDRAEILRIAEDHFRRAMEGGQ